MLPVLRMQPERCRNMIGAMNFMASITARTITAICASNSAISRSAMLRLGDSVTRVVEQAIDLAEPRGRPFYQFPQLLLAGDIGLHEARCGPKLARQRFTCVAPAAGDDRGGAFLDEEFSRARADAARAADDDCDLAIEDFHLCLLL